MRRTVAAMLLAIVAVTAVACGVPDSGEFQPISEDDFPRVIRETRPPTTTTTTTTTTTVPPTTATTVPGPTTTLARTTSTSSTTTTVPTEQIHLYYVQGTRVRAVVVSEKSPVTLQRKLLDLTERVGMTSTSTRLASVIPVASVLVSTSERGVVTVELGNSISGVLPEDQSLFFAQIVLTALAPSRLGQVVFTQRGVPYPAVKGDGTALDPGSPAAWEDYEDLIVDEPDVPVTTVRPTTTATTIVPIGS